jgi:regulator of sigma E protease
LEPLEPTDRQPQLNPAAETHITGSPPVVAEPPPAPATLQSWLRQNSSMLLIGALLIAAVYHYLSLDGLIRIGGIALGLGFVIFIHELGHFAVAKWCDVHVKTFSIGFGPALPGCSYQWGETTYMLAALPLGGYVQMVGEGSDEEDEIDPRSFKNKKVWQRMAIISAGVIMNVILGCACFAAVYQIWGVRQQPGIANTVEPGSAAWSAGLTSGSLLDRIGSAEHPYFEDLMNEVVYSTEGQKLDLVFRYPEPATNGGEPFERKETKVEPRKKPGELLPKIGVSSAPVLVLPPRPRGEDANKPPVFPNSAAASAQPSFDWGDRIVGLTDPNQPADHYDPNKLADLPKDWRFTKQDKEWQAKEDNRYDYFAYLRRLKQLEGKEIVVQVLRKDPKNKDQESLVSIKVPPSYYYDLGLRMKMGKVAAVRQGSPAAEAQLRTTQGAGGSTEADLITAVEVVDQNNKSLKWVRDPKERNERPLDPMRLPSELAQWADRNRARWATKDGEQPTPASAVARSVKLTILRAKGHDETPANLELTYDDDPRWRYEAVFPTLPTSPVAIPGLGLAYQVDNVVDAAEAKGPAAHADSETGKPFAFQKDDVVKAVCFYENDKPAEKSTWFGFFKERAWNELDPTKLQWPAIFVRLQMSEDKRVIFKVEREKQEFEVYLTAELDKTWPTADPGVLLIGDLRLQKASNPVDAVRLGVNRTVSLMHQFYRTLPNLVTGRIPKENLRGPVGIGQLAYQVAGVDWSVFVLFLGMISVNLAVVNFLPIPILDGGHMVFLIYELVRGKPASEQVKLTATYVGAGLLLSLMIFVLYIDLVRIVS